MKVKWKQEEIDFVRENANHMSAYDIGLKLGRSECSILHKLNRLGINKNLKYSKVKRYSPKQLHTKGWNDVKYIGQQYGKWKVIERVKSDDKKPHYLCETQLGEKRIFRQDYLERLNKSIQINHPNEDIKETSYKGIYVSKSGNVYRKFNLINGKYYFRKYSPCCTQGYLNVCASVDGKKRMLIVHRLVAETFIPNPNNYPIINHKDENKANNNVDNLEWCTHLYNNTYGNRIKKARETFYENRLRKQRQMA